MAEAVTSDAATVGAALRRGLPAPGALAVALLLAAACSPEHPAMGEGCTDCVVLDTLLTLDFQTTPTLPSPGGLLARSGTGVWAYVDRRVPHEILIFGPAGEYRRAVGREGSGPGEFQEITRVVFDATDTLWVFSGAGRRADLFGPDMEWARGMTLARGAWNAAALGDGRMVVATQGGAQAAAQAPARSAGGSTALQDAATVAFLARDGSLSPVAGLVFHDALAPVVPVTTDGDSRFWVAEPHTYRIREGRTDGSVRLLTETEPEWFSEDYSPEIKAEFGAILEDEGALILSLAHDPDLEALWIISDIPVADVEADVLRDALRSGEPEVMAELPRALADHVVHAVRVPSGEHLADGRFDYLGATVGEAFLYEVVNGVYLRILWPGFW